MCVVCCVLCVEQAEVTPSKEAVGAMPPLSLSLPGLAKLKRVKVRHEWCEFGEEATVEFVRELADYCQKSVGGLQIEARLAGMEEEKVGAEKKVGIAAHCSRLR